MAEERVFLSDSGIYISNTKVNINGTTYATANITSVAKRFTPASKGCAILLVVAGAFALLGSFGAFNSSASSGAVALLFALAILAAGIAWLRALKPTYHVVLASAAAERQGLSSKDEALVDRVTMAINDAITHRG
ncbi:MAG: DUF6232 family protein [Acidobacteriota bacterium]